MTQTEGGEPYISVTKPLQQGDLITQPPPVMVTMVAAVVNRNLAGSEREAAEAEKRKTINNEWVLMSVVGSKMRDPALGFLVVVSLL